MCKFTELYTKNNLKHTDQNQNISAFEMLIKETAFNFPKESIHLKSDW